MPSLSISTNVPLEALNTSEILSEISKSVAKIIGKPEAVNHPSLLFISFLVDGFIYNGNLSVIMGV